MTQSNGFDEWWAAQEIYRCSKKAAKDEWLAAQKFERERIKEIILDNRGVEAYRYLEIIDSSPE